LIEQAFKTVDQELINQDFLIQKEQLGEDMGSTADFVLIEPISSNENPLAIFQIFSLLETKKRLYIANIGDSRAILCEKGNAVALTNDHNTKNPQEVERVQYI